jgi:hypothetical protein
MSFNAYFLIDHVKGIGEPVASITTVGCLTALAVDAIPTSVETVFSFLVVW